MSELLSPDAGPGQLADETARAVEQLRIGDRLASFTVLLPARPDGEVLLAVADPVAGAIERRYPHARRYDPAAPPAPGSVGLLICDRDRADPAGLLPAVAADGVVAVIGRRGNYAIYPELEHPQQVWRRGWPLPEMVGPVAQLKRSAGLRTRVKRGVPRLTISGPPFVSLADRIAADLGGVLGESVELVGIVTAGHTVLRFRGLADYAVRLTWTDIDSDVLRESRVRRAVPTIAPLVATEVARGRTCGYPWAATFWVPQRRARMRDSWRDRERRWAAAERLAAGLQTVRTGCTAPGWARRWCDQATLLPPEAVAPLTRALLPLEGGLPTGWCHGDPWPGNVLLDGDDAAVIDWDNAVDTAPLGLDWLLICALRVVDHEQGMAAACTRLVDEPDLVRQPVAGRRWRDWDREHRVALALAALLLYLRNRALHDLGERRLERIVTDALALAEPVAAETAELLPWEVEPAAEDDPATAQASARAAVRGSWWLGASSIIGKGAQTLVLLVLAALLAPSALGLLAVGALIVNVCSAVTDLGSSTALVYWRGGVERAARSALTVALALSGAVTAACWFGAPWLAGALTAGPEGVAVIRGLTVVLPCYAVAGVTLEMLRRELAFARRAAPDVGSALVGAAVSLSLAATGYGVMSLVVGQMVQAVALMAMCWALRRPIRPGWHRGDVRGLIGYGGHIAGANVVQLLLLNVDYVIVARVLGPADLGQYSLAFRLAYLPFLNIAFVCCGAAFPVLCRMRGTALATAATQLLARTATLVAPLYLGMVLFAPQLELLGHKWAPAVPAVRWLAGYGLLLSGVQVCQTALNAVGRPRDTLVLRVLHLVALTGVLLAVARRGIVAVAIGQLAAAALVLAVALSLTVRHVFGAGARRLARATLPCLAGCAAMAGVVAVARWVAVPAVSPSTLLGPGVLALAGYGGTVWALRRRAPVPLAGAQP